MTQTEKRRRPPYSQGSIEEAMSRQLDEGGPDTKVSERFLAARTEESGEVRQPNEDED